MMVNEIMRQWDTKQIFDFSISNIALIVLFPLFLLIGFIVKMKLGSPVIFKQLRPGYDSKLFYLYKFRTMTDSRDDIGNLLSDEKRLTKFGKFLRSTSFDELPALYNVLRGEMSFVGPRPLLIQYLERYTPEQARRHEVKPGITGWAQVNGRNAISWEEKFKLDVWYVDNQSFCLDCKIFLKTIIKVLKRSDISAAGEATMVEFMGNKYSN